MDREAWHAVIHGVAKSRTWLSKWSELNWTEGNKAQAGIKIAGRNINNLTYSNDTTLMAESKEELMSLLLKVKEESEKVGLELTIQKTKIMASGPITSQQIDGEIVTDFIFLGSKIMQTMTEAMKLKGPCS